MLFHSNFKGTLLLKFYPPLFFILLTRELVKDLERIKGDFAQNYQTIAVKYGEHFTKILITILVVITLNPIYFLLKYLIL